MLEAKNIHKVYTNGKRNLAVLKGVNLVLDKGRFIAIVGPSGAGKSTLLHILGGLDSPTRGKVIFEGQDIYGLSDQLLSQIRNKKIGFVFQFYHLLSDFTVQENVMMPVLISARREARSAKIKEKAKKLFQQVGLSERTEYFPGQLSGGEKQRVAIVRALMNDPSLLLCDEPTGNLDSASGEEIFSLVKNINRENQMTTVLVTHNLELAHRADEVYHLKDGILVN
ncbi:MAG: ABC transporter ATP-binding protein [Candidatus Omnitrophota bacterium]